MVEAVVLIARGLLAAVFAVAATTKFADRSGSRQTMIDFGLPRRAARLLGIGVPAIELLITVTLLVNSTARIGATAALAMLVAFLLVIGWNLLQGRRPDCNCFGRLRAAPIGSSTVVRNLILAGVSGFIVWFDTASYPQFAKREPLHTLPVSLVTSVCLMAAGAVLGWFFLRYFARNADIPVQSSVVDDRQHNGNTPGGPTLHGSKLRLPTGLPVGSPAPEFELRSANGLVSLADLRRAGLPIVLLFLDPVCSDCRVLLPHILEWQREHANRISFAIVSRGSQERNRTKFGAPGIPPVLLQRANEVADLFGTWVVPSAVMVRPSARIGSRLYLGSGDVRLLVSRILSALAARAAI